MVQAEKKKRGGKKNLNLANKYDIHKAENVIKKAEQAVSEGHRKSQRDKSIIDSIADIPDMEHMREDTSPPPQDPPKDPPQPQEPQTESTSDPAGNPLEGDTTGSLPSASGGVQPDVREHTADLQMRESGSVASQQFQGSKTSFGNKIYKRAYQNIFQFPFTYEWFLALVGQLDNQHITDRNVLLRKSRCYLVIYGQALGIKDLRFRSVDDDIAILQRQHHELHELSSAVIIRPLNLPSRLREGEIKFGALVSMEDLGMNLENLRRVLRGERMTPSAPQGRQGQQATPPESKDAKPLRPFNIKEEDVNEKIQTSSGESMRDLREDEHIEHKNPRGYGINKRYDVDRKSGSVNRWDFHFRT